jgi:hypothetical protein
VSKYDPLNHHLMLSQGEIPLQFSDIEKLLGFPLPDSARRHAAWWSNSGGAHVQSLAWLSAGYRTADVNLEEETLRFVPEQRHKGFGEMKQAHFNQKQPQKAAPDNKGGKPSARHPAWGVWKGLVTLDPDYDYTQPADPEWGKVYED